MAFGSGSNILNKRQIVLFLSKRSKFLTIILLLIIFISSFFFIINPKYKKMKAVSESLSIAKTDELQKLEVYLGRLKSFNKSFEDVSSLEREKISKAIPEDKGNEELIIMLEDIVKNRGFTLNYIKIGEEDKKKSSKRVVEKKTSNEKGDNIGVLGFSISISDADYDGVKTIIADFERNLRIMDIQSVEFVDGSSLILKINTYYFKS